VEANTGSLFSQGTSSYHSLNVSLLVLAN